MAGGVLGQRPPAGANLQQMIAGSERQLVAQARHLGPLGLGQILLVVGKQRAGVEQVVIQKVGIKFVAEVVMGGDVLPRLGAGVAAGPVAQPGDGLAQQTEAALQTPQHLAVAREDLKQRRQLVALPVAVHPGLGRRQAAAGQQTPVHLRRADPHLGAQRGGGVAKMKSLHPFAHGERAFAEATQQTKKQPAREPHVARHIGFKRKDGIGHERSLLLTGWLYSGTRFSHSRSACQ